MNHTAPTTVGRYRINGYYADYEVTVMRDGDITYPLTPCCDASGKGLMDDNTGEGYVGCRSCYHEVDPVFGTGWYSEQEWDAALEARTVVPL